MVNPGSEEDSGLVQVLAIPSKIVKNLTNMLVSYTSAEGHVRVLDALGCLSFGTVRIKTFPFQFSGYL